MTPVGFEPTISAGERPQTYDLGPLGPASPDISRSNQGACNTHKSDENCIEMYLRKTIRVK